MTDGLPSYDEIGVTGSERSEIQEGDIKPLQRFSIRDEVGTSRAQHVAALVARLLPQVRLRAKSGLSRMTFWILPSDQAAILNKGQPVVVREDDQAVFIQLEGLFDSTEFWAQQSALDELRDQTVSELVGEMPTPGPVVAALPERPSRQPKMSLWGRKQSKAPEPASAATPEKSPVTVQVQLDQVNFRRENAFGLYETARGQAVTMVVTVE